MIPGAMEFTVTPRLATSSARYITRPALSDERLQINTAGQVELKLKTLWRDRTTHLVMSPLEFMQRLAALIPRPRLHLIRFHGVLAPNAKLRALVVPQGPPAQEESATEAVAASGCEVESVLARPNRVGWRAWCRDRVLTGACVPTAAGRERLLMAGSARSRPLPTAARQLRGSRQARWMLWR